MKNCIAVGFYNDHLVFILKVTDEKVTYKMDDKIHTTKIRVNEKGYKFIKIKNTAYYETMFHRVEK